MTMWLGLCIVSTPIFHPFVRVIDPMAWTLKLTGLWKSFIECWFCNYKHISFRPTLTASGLMGGSFFILWVHIRQSPRHLVAGPLTTNNLFIRTLSMSTLPLVIASWSAAFDMLVFLFAILLVTTGCLVSRIFSSDSILVAFCLFQANAGYYTWYFQCDCDAKLFGTKICEHLIDNDSNIIATAAGCQSFDGLVELHWKVMVHTSHAYPTKKQMPQSFWFYIVVHSAPMMSVILGKFGGKLASPFLLANDIGQDKCTWFPIFPVCYFHHE
jgi:hypothetical protein